VSALLMNPDSVGNGMCYGYGDGDGSGLAGNRDDSDVLITSSNGVSVVSATKSIRNSYPARTEIMFSNAACPQQEQ
jgi:hypothetical protein